MGRNQYDGEAFNEQEREEGGMKVKLRVERATGHNHTWMIFKSLRKVFEETTHFDLFGCELSFYIETNSCRTAVSRNVLC